MKHHQDIDMQQTEEYSVNKHLHQTANRCLSMMRYQRLEECDECDEWDECE